MPCCAFLAAPLATRSFPPPSACLPADCANVSRQNLPGSLPAQPDVFAGEYGAKRLADLKLRVIEHNVLVVTKYYTRITTARLAELLDLKPEEVRVCVRGGGVEIGRTSGTRLQPAQHPAGRACTRRQWWAGSPQGFKDQAQTLALPVCCVCAVLALTLIVLCRAGVPPPAVPLPPFVSNRPPSRRLQAEKQLSELVVAKAVSAKIDRPAGVVVIGKPQAPEDVLNGWSRNISKLLGLVEKVTQQIQKEAMVHKVQLGAAA